MLMRKRASLSDKWSEQYIDALNCKNVGEDCKAKDVRTCEMKNTEEEGGD